MEAALAGKLKPVGFFSRKLTAGQRRSWSTREQETYGLVSALAKWASIIGLQPVTILTDHKSLESWSKEVLDTPSGPAGRRARWHEFLSRFNLQVIYVPGKQNDIPDALSRWAYPASQALADCSFHGSSADAEEMKAIIADEAMEERGGCVAAAAVLGTVTAPTTKFLALNLFNGTGSVSAALVEMGFEVFSLDIKPSSHPTYCIDIMQWDYRSIKPGTFDIIFASPPCQEFSIAKTIGERDLGYALKLVTRVLQIIEYLRPKAWIVENPQTGYLARHPIMAPYPYRDFD